MRRALKIRWWVGMLGLAGIGILVEWPGVAVAQTSSDTAQILIIIPERSDRASTAGGAFVPTPNLMPGAANLPEGTQVTLIHDGDAGIVRYTTVPGR